MSTSPASGESTLNWTDLRCQVREVLSGLVRGQTYLITHDGQPLAHLVPVPQPVVPPAALRPYDPQALRTLESVLREPHVSSVLGLSGPTFTRLCAEGVLPGTAQERLGLLVTLVDTLLQVGSRQRVHAWLYRSRRQLQNRSVVLTLCFPWKPGDDTILLVQALAEEDLRRLSLPRELLPPGKRWL